MASSGDIDEEADTRRSEANTETLSKAEARPVQAALTKELDEVIALRSTKDLLGWLENNRMLINSLPPDWKILLKDSYQKAFIDIQAQEKLDGKNADRP
jgi:hypothetical protein